MATPRAHLTAAALLLLAIAGSSAAQSLEAQVSPRSVYIGESISLHVSVHNCDGCERPMLPASYARDFTLQPHPKNSQTRVSMVNGQMTRLESVTYPWVLVPRKAGFHRLEAIELVTPAGETIEARPPSVQVLEPDAHGELFVDAIIEPPGVVREQVLKLKLEIGVRSEATRHPLARASRPLIIQLPWLDLGEEFETADLPEWLKPILAQRGSFHIDGTTISSGGFFSSSRQALFDLPARREERIDPSTGELASYWVYSLERTAVPLASGTYDLGRAVVKGPYAGRQRYLVSEPVVLEIGDAPRASRPASWTGAIGSLELRASADPVKVRIGDPIEVTLELGGDVRIGSLFLPDLSEQPALAGSFKIYQEQSGSIENGWKRFKLQLRPTTDAITELPPIELATYDSAAGRYLVLTTEPIPIEVEASEALNPTEVIAGEGIGRRGTGHLQRSAEGVQANHAGARVHEDHGHLPRLTLGLATFLLVLWAALAVAAGRYRKLHQDPVLVRRRGAGRKAQEALASANDWGEVAAALSGFVADVRGIPAEGLTAREVAAHLEEAGLTSDEAAPALSFLESCEAARYGGSAAADADAAASSRAAGEAMLARLQQLLAAIVVTVGVCLSSPAAGAADADSLAAGILEADATFREASDPTGFLLAAARYRRVLDDGLTNGHLYYNLGNSYARAGEVGKAIAAYEVALRYAPRDPDIIENLRVMRSRCVDGFVRPRSLAARILFWQPWLGVHEHARAVIALALLAFVVACLRLWQPTRVPRWLVATLALVALLQIGTYAQMLSQLASTQGVVTAQEVVPRKGPGDDYDPAFQKPVHEGAPFIVRERRAGWLNVELPGGQLAWLEEAEAETY